MKTEVLKIKAEIKKANSIYLTTHFSPDDDAVGSLLGMYLHLIKKYPKKEITMGITGAQQNRWDFLEGSEKIEWLDDIAYNAKAYELIIMLDCSAIYRATGKEEILKNAKVICIDHHQPEKSNFSISLQNQAASSTAQIIADSFLENEDFADPCITKPLFMGIYQDSGGFKYVTKEQTGIFSSSEKLLAQGHFDIQSLVQRLDRITPETYEAWKILMQNSVMQKHSKAPYVYSYVKGQDKDKLGAANTSSGRRNFLDNCAKRVLGYSWGFATYIATSKDEWSIAFRSTPGGPNVQKICKEHFNGNGHILAAGGQIPLEKYNTAEEFALDVVKLLSEIDLELTKES